MPKRSRAKIRRLLLTRLKAVIKNDDDLEKRIDDFVDEYLEKCAFLEHFTVDELPTSKDIKWWFQNKPRVDQLKVKLSNGKYEPTYEINIDKICLNNELATEIFKYYYKWYWENDIEIPEVINKILDIYQKFKRARKPETKKSYEVQLNNMAIVGVIRLYGIEREPYMCLSETSYCCERFFNALEFLLKIRKKKFKKDATKRLYIFDAFSKIKEMNE